MVNALDVIIQSTNGQNKRVWIGTPMMQDPKDFAYSGYKYYGKTSQFFQVHEKMFIQYIDDLRIALGPEKWNKYVAGIYMHSEEIYGANCNLSVNASKFLEHPHIKLFNTISEYVHKSYSSGGKTWNAVQFLWSPYYPTRSDSHPNGISNEAEYIQNFGLITNKTNIFDEVLLQAGHYFHSTDKVSNTINLDAIKEGTNKQAVTWRCDQNNQYVIVDNVSKPSKTSNTRVGVQMEFDKECFTNAKKMKYYNDYVSYFNNNTHIITGYNKNKYPFSYYFGAKDEKLKELTNHIREFYDVIPF